MLFILVGDLLQLQPVRGAHVFTEETLWHLVVPYFLTTNVRQRNDTGGYAQLLNRARVGQLTKEDVHSLMSRLIHPLPFLKCSVVHVFPTNQANK